MLTSIYVAAVRPPLRRTHPAESIAVQTGNWFALVDSSALGIFVIWNIRTELKSHFVDLKILIQKYEGC
jgi:hypothetical protein